MVRLDCVSAISIAVAYGLVQILYVEADDYTTKPATGGSTQPPIPTTPSSTGPTSPPVTPPGTPLTGSEALARSLLALFVITKFDLRDTVAAHQNDPNPGFFLKIILDIDAGFQLITDIITAAPNASVTGAQCLAVDTLISDNMGAVVQHNNDALIGLPDSGIVEGESLYQRQLQRIGITFTTLIEAVRVYKDVPNPGRWLSIILRLGNDSLNVQAVARNNDTSSNCFQALVNLAQSNIDAESAYF